MYIDSAAACNRFGHSNKPKLTGNTFMQYLGNDFFTRLNGLDGTGKGSMKILTPVHLSEKETNDFVALNY